MECVLAEHGFYAYNICSLSDLIRGLVGSPKLGIYELLAIFVKEVKDFKMSTGRNLDQLSEAIPDLCSRQSTKESKVQESVDGRMVGAKTVLVVTVVDGDLDANAGIDQPDNCCRDSNEVGVPAIGGTREPDSHFVSRVK